VPHHGSKGSLLPGFYEKIQPRYAVISVGNNNIFGHPHPEVIDVLKKNHIKIMRTDQSGAVTVLSDGSKMKIRATVRPDSQQMKKDKPNQQPTVTLLANVHKILESLILCLLIVYF
jgi:beta-lactamase superfamily II metal-dependent hydrolase